MSEPHQKLAVEGAVPAFPEGPPLWPLAEPAVRDALELAFQDGSWGRYHGPQQELLSGRLASLLGVAHVTPCASGTIAVELALRGLKVGPGDEVMVAAYDFPGNFRAIEATGARAVLVDVEPTAPVMDAERLEAAHGPAVRAVLVSHLHGTCADMPRICEFAASRGLGVVEDACQACGGSVAGRLAGTWGNVGVWSFGGSKLLTAGRGGALFTADETIHQRVKIFANRGNEAFPLSLLQAAVLLPQLDLLGARQQRRLAAADRLRRRLEGATPWRLVRSRADARPDTEPAFFKVGLLLDGSAKVDHGREILVGAVQAEGVALDAGFRDFTRRGAARCRHGGSLEHAARFGRDLLVLHHPILLAEDEVIDRLAAALAKVAARGDLAQLAELTAARQSSETP